MSKMVKEYVLVPADIYNRKWGAEDTTNPQTNEPRETPHQPINPFANPNVRKAKQNRKRMMQVVNDRTIAPEDANILLRNLLQSYGNEVESVLAPKKLANRLNQLKAKREIDQVRPQPDPVNPVGNAVQFQRQQQQQQQHLPEVYGPLGDFEDEMEAPPAKKKKPKAKKVKKSALPSVEMIERAKDFMGGHLNDDDAMKSAALLKQMDDAGMMEDDWKKGAWLEGNRKISGAQLRNLLRDAYVADTDKRSLTNEYLEKFAESLKVKGIATGHAPREIRKSNRRK